MCRQRTARKIAVELPFDVVYTNILPRLPGKSVGKFRCVSKLWYSLLRKPKFCRMHQIHHAPQKLLIISDSYKPKRGLYTLDYEAKEHVSVLKHGFPSGDVQFARPLCSCDGIVCLGVRYVGSSSCNAVELVLWNPLTRDSKKIQSRPDVFSNYLSLEAWGFFYDDAVDDYKIVSIGMRDEKAYMYNLKSDSWRELGHVGFFGTSQTGVLFDGKLYWGTHRDHLLCFDLRTEKFMVIKCHDFETRHSTMYVAIHQDRLYMFMSYNSENKLELWRTNESDEHYTYWEKAIIYSSDRPVYGRPRPICFTMNGAVVMLHGYPKSDVVIYNPRSPSEIEHHFHFQIASEELVIWDVITYTENVLSLNDIS